MMKAASLAEFVARCRDGDPAALEEFARRYGPEVERLARAILDSFEDVQDATQEALISAIEGLSRFRGESDLRTWVLAIARNSCRKKIRANQTRQRLLGVLGGLLRLQTERNTGVERQAETRLDLHSTLSQLDEKHRIALILRYGHGLRVAEIARATGTGENTVLSRLFHTREKLRCVLEGEEE